MSTKLMGILNVTPDSFSDGGKFFAYRDAVNHASELLQAGADIIDIGGESTRPGAIPVSAEEELSRVIPVICELKKLYPSCVISIDTTKPEVALAAVKAGADIINDISGLQASEELAKIAAKYKKSIILMHMRGTPQSMQQPKNLIYKDLINDISDFLRNAAVKAEEIGVSPRNIIIDPGIGFSKTWEQNIYIIKNIRKFKNLGYSVLVGHSKKSFIGKILDEPCPDKRIWGTSAISAWLIIQNIDILRVHDVFETKQILKVLQYIISETSSF